MADISKSEETPFGKRKRSPDSPVHVSHPSGTAAHHSTQPSFLGSIPLPKRPRLPKKQSGIGLLPPGLLQHVFSYVDPFSLASMATVNRFFRSLLDERYAINSEVYRDDKNSLQVPDIIWSRSRRRYLGLMPKPVAGLSERAQFLLAFGTQCEFCGKSSARSSLVTDPWRAGPGDCGVRIIWPFRIRSCTSCLVPRIQKDAEILLSDASALLPGLPFALFTHSMDYVPESVVRDGLPFGTTMQKFYLTSDVETLDQRLQQAKSFGSAAAEEWLKGLSSEGRAAQSDAARFQQWESHGQLQNLRGTLDHRSRRAHLSTLPKLAPHALPARPPASDMKYDSLPGMATAVVSALPPMPAYALAPGLGLPQSSAQVQTDSMSLDSQRSTGTNRATKSSRERAKIRSQKKMDIIERCRKLIPPITKDQLEDLDAFDAALKIPIPLNENSWPLLRDNLLQQRRKVMLADEDRNGVRTAPVPGIYAPLAHSDEFLLAHAGDPKREKLCKIAEDFIRQKWGYGGFVTYPTSPQFAAEVLIHTKKTYEDEKARIYSIQASSGFIAVPLPQEDLLRLEDMKWIFDQTIKPRTEQIRKDLFICPVCPTVGSVKYFAFESIIQHYASKHTDAFSRGTQMVNWKADWPVAQPFSAHPERVHTPTPSITHTPTLSAVPLSTTSSGSILTSTVPSAGWYTPDNMSLASSASRTYSAVGSTVPAPAIKPPGSAMYEAQRDGFSLNLLRSLDMLPASFRMPINLRTYLIIAVAIAQFKEKWSNLPGLMLFRDCLQAKRELESLKDVENLRCAECAAARAHNSRARWSLSDLIVHFQNAHIEQCIPDVKLDWKNDMILLPEPEIVIYEQSDPAMPEFLRQYFVDAVTTSTIQATNTAVLERQDYRGSESDVHHSHGSATHVLTPMDQVSQPHAVYDKLYRNRFRDRFDTTRPHIDPSTAATYGESGMLRDPLLPGTSRDYHRSHPPSSIDHEHESHLHQSHQLLFPQSASNRGEGNERIILTQAESMTRTNTVRSYKSRNEPCTTDADDFLSTIDAYVDTEMGDHYTHHNAGTSTVQADSPYERPDTSRPIISEMRPRHANEPHTNIPYENMDSMVVVRREPSRVIEFDDNGTPISHGGHIYQEISPRRRVIRQQSDAPPQEMVQLTLNDRRALTQHEHGFTHGITDQSLRRVYSTQPYRRIEYLAEPSRHTQRSHDHGDNFRHTEMSGPIRRYVEINDADGRTISAQSVPDHLGHYRNIESLEHDLRIERQAPRFSGYEERTYYRR